MIVTDRFVFLHLHKSGGTFVNECLMRFVPGARQLGYHLPRQLIPGDAASLPVLGLVRNPWSYYVSWHAFQAARPRPNALYRILSDDGTLDFKGTVANMLQLGSESRYLDRLLQALPDSYGMSGLNLPAHALAGIRDTGMGFYSWLYRYMFGADGPQLRVGRMERLRDELPAMIAATGTNIAADMLEFIRRAAPVNASAHRRYAEMYDQDLRDLVAGRDAQLIATHGFSFGS